MSRKKSKKTKNEDIKYGYYNISQEHMIEIQAEAYYRALKRMEQEKGIVKESIKEKEEEKWYLDILFALNILFVPWKISKRFKINNQIYDSVPVLVVSGLLRIVGTIIWLLGILLVLVSFYKVNAIGISAGFFVGLSVGVFFVIFGSIFVIAGSEFSKEVDSNKIYAYSASVLALISCTIGMIALLK